MNLDFHLLIQLSLYLFSNLERRNERMQSIPVRPLTTRSEHREAIRQEDRLMDTKVTTGRFPFTLCYAFKQQGPVARINEAPVSSNVSRDRIGKSKCRFVQMKSLALVRLLYTFQCLMV